MNFYEVNEIINDVILAISFSFCCLVLYFYHKYKSDTSENYQLITYLLISDMFYEFSLFIQLNVITANQKICLVIYLFSYDICLVCIFTSTLIAVNLYAQLQNVDLWSHKFQFMLIFGLSTVLTLSSLFNIDGLFIYMDDRCTVGYNWFYYMYSSTLTLCFIINLILIILSIIKIKQIKKSDQFQQYFRRLIVYPLILLLYLLPSLVNSIGGPNLLQNGSLNHALSIVSNIITSSLGLMDALAYSRIIFEMRREYLEQIEIVKEIQLNLSTNDLL